MSTRARRGSMSSNEWDTIRLERETTLLSSRGARTRRRLVRATRTTRVLRAAAAAAPRGAAALTAPRRAAVARDAMRGRGHCREQRGIDARARDRVTDVFLDFRQRKRVGLADEVNGVAARARARGAADAVNVVIRVMRQIEVTDVRH